jgi:hypothetical protein
MIIKVKNIVLPKIKYKGYTIKILRDEPCESPREWENLGIMICNHRRYDLGDIVESKDFHWDEFSSWEEAKNYLFTDMDAAAVLPIYLNGYGRPTINTKGFSQLRDSGQVGFIYATKEKIREVFGWKRLTEKRLKHIEEILNKEVKIYNMFLLGDIYGYIIEKNDDQIDSCGGYYGKDYCLAEAKLVVDRYEKQRRN